MVSLEDSYRYAEALTRAEARNFFYAFRFLPPVRRRSICAVYAFSRRSDDAVDAVETAAASEEEARARLEVLRSFLGESPPDDPLVPALRDTIERFSVPRSALHELIAGMEMDLVKKRYESFAELYEYCYRAASVIGLVCIQIFGHRGGEAPELAIKLGIAMQLTNILRDLKEDERRGRIYLPADEMRRFGYTAGDISRSVVDDRFRALMRYQVARARTYFTAAQPLFPLLLPESRQCPVLLMRFYSRILDIIEERGYDVLSRRPRLPLLDKLRMAGSLWIESAALRRGLQAEPIQKDVT
jgi:phytoene synthase